MELSSAENEVEQYKEKYGIVDLSSEAGLYLTESTEYRKRASEIETQLNLVQSKIVWFLQTSVYLMFHW